MGIAPLWANPKDGVVSAGQAVISAMGKKLDIRQSSDRAVIDWRGFDIAPDEHTQFYQPGSNSLVLNRIIGDKTSLINGKLTANGKVFIVNQNGIIFGKDARVDVNALLATSADIGNDNFMNGRLFFDKTGKPDAAIINEGNITAGNMGLVGLVAPHVVNSGTLKARLGKVQLASGDATTVDLYGDGLLEVQVSNKVKSQLVANTGVIEAQGGEIALTAAAGRDIVNSVISVGGTLNAQSVGASKGEVRINAEGANAVKGNIAADKGRKQGASTVLVQAHIDASGQNNGESGGTISVAGDNIAILNGTVMNVSGHDGTRGTTAGKKLSDKREKAAGGEILIGGNYLGQGDMPAAKNLYVDTYTLFYADAMTSGDAGRAIFWADNSTVFKGNVYARGGVYGGDGGFVETSGRKHLDAAGAVNLSAMNGSKGTYFLDPADITIYGNVDPAFASTDGSVDLGASQKLWLDASDGSTIAQSGGLVSQWSDKSGAGNNATTNGAARPTLVASAQNGHDVLSFDGNDFFAFPRIDATGVTVLSVYRASSGNFGVIVDMAASGGPSENYGVVTGDGSGRWAFAWMNGGSQELGVNPAGGQNAYLIRTDRHDDLGNVDIWQNGDNIASASGAAMLVPNPANTGSIGSYQVGATGNFQGTIAEIILFNTGIPAKNRELLEQYQSAKWNVALNPPGSGVSEAARATAADGYSVFSTRYIERLSQSANISLQADHSITLDLKGDTLALADGRSFSLSTTSGNIAAVSAGTLETRGAGGDITLNAGGTGKLSIGNLALKASGALNLVSTSSPYAISFAHGTMSMTSPQLSKMPDTIHQTSQQKPQPPASSVQPDKKNAASRPRGFALAAAPAPMPGARLYAQNSDVKIQGVAAAKWANDLKLTIDPALLASN